MLWTEQSSSRHITYSETSNSEEITRKRKSSCGIPTQDQMLMEREGSPGLGTLFWSKVNLTYFLSWILWGTGYVWPVAFSYRIQGCFGLMSSLFSAPCFCFIYRPQGVQFFVLIFILICLCCGFFVLVFFLSPSLKTSLLMNTTLGIFDAVKKLEAVESGSKPGGKREGYQKGRWYRMLWANLQDTGAWLGSRSLRVLQGTDCSWCQLHTQYLAHVPG